MLKQIEPAHQSPVSPADIDSGQRPALARYRSWQKFHNGPRQRPEPLLKTLGKYPDAVLVAGCQRSGTTMLTRIIARAAGFRALALTHDDELDAALALCGELDLPGNTRYCFQTTYLNENLAEYGRLGAENRLIWVLRNPYSVVHSMVYNWKRFALNELYEACGLQLADSPRLRRARYPWPAGPSRLEKACLSYSGKISQILTIETLVAPDRLFVVDYDEMVRSPDVWLPAIFKFIGEPYTASYASGVRADSMKKADTLAPGVRRLIEERCDQTYRRCLETRSDATRV